MKKLIFILPTFVVLLILSISCNNNDDDIPVSTLTVSVALPEVMGDGILPDGLTVTVTNVTTGSVKTEITLADGTASLIVEEGVYNISVSGEKTYTITAGTEDFEQTVTLNGILENKSITGTELTMEIDLIISSASSGWVFKELYFTGSQTPAGSSYYKDKFFEIYNNTDQVLYADGISIGESDHVTTSETNDWSSIIDEAFVTQVIYTIPGSGTDYPVQPGASIVFTDVAIDHTTVNPNSFDLSGADFEWYDDHNLDVDIPEVTNLTKYFSSSLTIWTPHNKGFRSYVIFRPEGTMDEFMIANKVTRIAPSGSTLTRYKVPNSLILDAVELGTPSEFMSKALSSSLDVSYTHCADGDASRFGKCVRRKIQSVVDGRIIYMDTNNSAADFLNTVNPKPGIIEEE